MGAILKPTRSPDRQTVKAGLASSTKSEHDVSLLGKVPLMLLSLLKWLAIALLALVVAALVLVSLVWGPTPIVASLLLAAAWVGLVGLLLLGPGQFERWRAQLAATLGFFALGLTTVIVSQVSAYTPPVVDADGMPVPGSIASLETVRLGGTDQWISIRGHSTGNPVLLWLSGGPGGSQLATARYHLGGLEEHFVVVNWEQPGSGKSYNAVAHSALTVERYISDGYELALYLKQRFGEEKIFIVGESWGSALSIWLAQRYPEQFHAIVNTGQMVDFIETDALDYEFALQQARGRGNTAKVEELERQGPPPYYGDGVIWKQAAYLLDGFAYMNSDPDIAQDDGFDTFKDILSPEYGLYDKINWARGVIDAGNVMFPQLWKADVDFRRDAPRLDVPVYFLIGRHDINAPTALAEEYYQMLDAPHKEWVWFERSGHNPWVTESAKFVELAVNKVLADTQPR
jgi:pimeloyl-ACP methyl ester carboxylesterase